MIDAIKTLFDLVAGLVNERSQGKRALFQEYAAPVFEAAKGVFDDYLAMFTELRKKVLDDRPLEELHEFLVTRRTVTLSLRHQLRAQVLLMEERSSKPLPAFESAILNLFMGVARDHTIIWVSERIDSLVKLQQPDDVKFQQWAGIKQCLLNERYKSSILRDIDLQMRFLEAQFKIVAQEYAAMQVDQAPPGQLNRKRK